MSVLSVLIFIARGAHIRRGYSKKLSDDATYLDLFSRALIGQEISPGKLSAALEQCIKLVWEDVYDFVNPFGDSRGGQFNSVWTFDLDKDILFLRKNTVFRSTSLQLARERLLTLDDFESLGSPTQLSLEEQALPGPYWEPNLHCHPRLRSFAGRILRDFIHTWRHIFRRQMKTTTFLKLGYAIIWILRLKFTIQERVGFEHISSGGPYVQVADLPQWHTPEVTLVKADTSWFVLTQNIREGVDMARRHWSGYLTPGEYMAKLGTYIILSPGHITVCKAYGSEVVWTRLEKLFEDTRISDTAIDMMLWATSTTSTTPQANALNSLPVDIQDRILRYATTSLVASAKLGCEHGLGSPFSWVDGGVKISVEEAKRHRFESSPVESQIVLNGTMSGLSYKRERGYHALHLIRPQMPRSRKEVA